MLWPDNGLLVSWWRPVWSVLVSSVFGLKLRLRYKISPWFRWILKRVRKAFIQMMDNIFFSFVKTLTYLAIWGHGAPKFIQMLVSKSFGSTCLERTLWRGDTLLSGDTFSDVSLLHVNGSVIRDTFSGAAFGMKIMCSSWPQLWL